MKGVVLAFLVTLFGVGLLLSTPPQLYSVVFGVLFYILGLLVFTIVILKKIICDEETRKEVCGGKKE